MYKNNLFKTILLLALAGLVALSGCQAKAAAVTPTPEVAPGGGAAPLISSTGKVVPAKFSTLSIATAGLVEQVMVAEGDQVKAGQSLLRLKGKEDLQAALVAANLDVLAAQQALDKLDEDATLRRAEAMRAVSEAQSAVRDAKYRLDNFVIPTNQAKMNPIEAIEMTRKKLDVATKAYKPYRLEEDPPYNPRTEKESLKKELKDKLENAQADYNTAVRRLEYEVKMAEAQTRLDKALADFEKVKDGPDPKEMALARARLDDAKARQLAAQSALADLEFHAPFDGTVSKVYARVGEWLSPGQPVALVADLAGLQVETTDLNEIDVARINVGDPVKVTFDALPDVSIPGKVTQISVKSAEGSGVNYTVTIKMDQLPERLRWGMTAFVDIEVK